MKKILKYIINKFFDIDNIQKDILINCFNYELSEDDIKYLNNRIDELFKTK